MISRELLDKAIYSASVDDKAIVACFRDPHVIAALPARKTYPEVDLYPSALAYAASEYP
jgi:hypothetical protein